MTSPLQHLASRPPEELFAVEEGAIPCRITTTFVRDTRKIALAKGLTVAAGHLLVVLKQLQAGDYNGAVSYAKEHGFDLETLKYKPKSGVLQSNWNRMAASLKLWGTRPQFISMDKTLSIAPDVVNAVTRKKYEADTPYRR